MRKGQRFPSPFRSEGEIPYEGVYDGLPWPVGAMRTDPIDFGVLKPATGLCVSGKILAVQSRTRSRRNPLEDLLCERWPVRNASGHEADMSQVK